MITCIHNDEVYYITKIDDFGEICGDGVLSAMKTIINQGYIDKNFQIEQLEEQVFCLEMEIDDLKDEYDYEHEEAVSERNKNNALKYQLSEIVKQLNDETKTKKDVLNYINQHVSC